MKHEIERKYLVINDGWKAAVTRTVHLRDGLVASFGAGKVRVRVATVPGAEPRAWITLKGPRSGISRRELEYEVPVAEAETRAGLAPLSPHERALLVDLVARIAAQVREA
jgi:CYTH domain-containing protein